MPTLTQADLNGFTGSLDWTRFNPVLFRNVIASEGMMHVAEAGEAYWLLDAIASHEAANSKLRAACAADAGCDYLHFWTLTVDLAKKSATLVCRKDSDQPAIVTQRIKYTDFCLPSLTVYAGNDGPGTPRKLFLPSEY